MGYGGRGGAVPCRTAIGLQRGGVAGERRELAMLLDAVGATL